MVEIKASLTSGPVGKTLIKLTVPMIFGLMSVIGFSIVDTFFVAQLGTAELAAMSFTFPVVTFFSSIALGIGTGASSVISRAIGEGNSSKVRRLTTDSIVLSFLIVVIFLTIGLFTIDPLFRLLGASDKILPLINEYMSIWYYGMCFVIVPMVGNSAIRAAGDSKTPGIIMVIAAVTNVILDPIFIFGFFGVPALGLKGAAIATVMARAFTMFASLWVLHYKKKMITLKITDFKEIIDSWYQVLYIGLPSALSRAIIPLSIGVVTAFIAMFGQDAVAAYGVVTRIEAFSLLIIMAISAVFGPYVGQNWSSSNYSRVYDGIFLIFKFSLIYSIFIVIFLGLFSKYLIMIFDDSPQVISFAVLYLLFVPFSYFFESIRMIFTAFFNALGKPIPATLMVMGKMFLLIIPLTFIGMKAGGVIGIFIAISLSNIICGLISYYYTINELKSKISQL